MSREREMRPTRATKKLRVGLVVTAFALAVSAGAPSVFATAKQAASAPRRSYRDSFERKPTGKHGAWAVTNPQGYAWDSAVARTGGRSVRLGGRSGHIKFQGPPVAIRPGDFVEGSAWVRTQNAVGKTYMELRFFRDGKMVHKRIGGAAFGVLTHRPNPVRGTHDWTFFGAREWAPKAADSVRLVLITHENTTGRAWFDDVNYGVVAPARIRGRLQREPVRVDPTSLTPDDYVTARDGRLWRKGKRLRIWSAQGNLMAQTAADIDREVVRFAWHGFTAHRCLWWRSEVDDTYVPGDGSLWDRRDYLIAALGRQGVLFWCDLLNSCRIRPEMADAIDDPSTAGAWREAVAEMTSPPGRKNRYDYALIRSFLPAPWDPRTRRIYHNYIRRLLAHRNPYNGLTYAEDPTFFCWELTNEQWWIMKMLWGNHRKLPAFFQKQLHRRWSRWLQGQYRSQEQLLAAWGRLSAGESLPDGTVLMLPLLGGTDAASMARTLGLDVQFVQRKYGPKDFPPQRAADVVRFLMETSVESKQAAAAVFRAQGRPGLGCRIVPLLFDTGYSGAVLPLYLHAQADAVAVGTYLDMSTHDPTRATFPFASGLTSPPGFNAWLDGRRVLGKPTFVYEVMCFNPQKYRVEFPYRLLAMASVQDYDVVDYHFYGHPLPVPSVPNPYGRHRHQYLPRPRRPGGRSKAFNSVHMRTDEVLMSAVRLAGEIFKSGWGGRRCGVRTV